MQMGSFGMNWSVFSLQNVQNCRHFGFISRHFCIHFVHVSSVFNNIPALVPIILFFFFRWDYFQDILAQFRTALPPGDGA